MANYSTFKKINSESIVDASLTAADIGTGAVSAGKIGNTQVTSDKIGGGAVTSGKLASTLDISGKTVTYRPIVSNDFANSAISGTQLESGATVANVGYTPVNTGGDSITGQLVVANGTTISNNSNTNSGVHINGQSISIRESGTDRLAFDTSGRPTQSNHPAWQASGNGGWRYSNSYGGPGWRELDDMAWNYSTQGGITTSNNCRVTVPIAGYYYCYLQTYWYNDSNSTNGYTHFHIARNGTTAELPSGRTNHQMFAYGLRNNYTPSIATSYVRYLNAGQYVTPAPYFGGNQGRQHGNHSYWCGYLIG